MIRSPSSSSTTNNNQYKKDYKSSADSYSQFLTSLKTKDQRNQLKVAKEFYAFLLNELKKVKREDEITFVDNLMPNLRELANENNQNIHDKLACIYIITSIINLDSINVKVRKKHQTNLIRWLKNLLACSDQTVIHMASRAMGKYVQAGVDCDVEFKSGLESLRIESKRYQGIISIREMALAYPPRLLLHSDTFFHNIMQAISDRSPQLRYEAIELFRLALIISVNRELTSTNKTNTSNNVNNAYTSNLNQRIRRTSTTSSFSSTISNQDSNANTNQAFNSLNNFNSTTGSNQSVIEENLAKFKDTFKSSIDDLEALIKDYNSSSLLGKTLSYAQTNNSTGKDDRIHGYLLIILEIVKFSCLEFEQQIEKYLSTYNLYHQQMQQINNNTYSNAHSQSGSGLNKNQNLNLFENTARSCEEIHANNLLKLLPNSCLDPFHTNDPFLFLFISERISINVESQTCMQLIASNYDRIVKLCLSIIKLLNLSNSNINNSSSYGAASYSTSTTPSGSSTTALRCILETILQLLPRLARFNTTVFNSFYLKDTLAFLTSLNNNTNYLSTTNTSTSSAQSRTSQTSQTTTSTSNQSNDVSTVSLNSGATFCLGTVKSEIIFCVGFMSLALGNTSDEFRSYSKQFIDIFRTSPLLNSRDAQRRKNFTDKEALINELNSIMACVAMFSSSMVSNLDSVESSTDHNSSDSLVESIMVLLEPLMLNSGGITYTMRYFLNEISLHIPGLKASIHENLLKILSQILTGRPLSQIIQSISSSASHLIRSNNFYSLMSSLVPNSSNSLATNSSQTVRTNTINRSMSQQQFPQLEETPPQVDTESLIQALQTLRAFEFPSIYIIVFLRYCVDFYIQHETCVVKIETIITTSTLLSRLITTLNSQDSRSLISIISCVLRKLLICAITDYEPDVRYHVLNSLDNDHKFNMFVSLPENLNILFMCVRDERAEIRELSASMISRLSASNSAYILPFIRKILMQLLTEVDIYPDMGQLEKSVRLMGHLLCHAPRLVNLYVKPLLDCLHSKLMEYRHDIPFASSIVTVVGQLASQSSPETLEHFDSIIPFLNESMQDFYYVQLKHTAIWALGQIIANTGYVIEPYKKYPNLLEILLGFLQTETSTQIRRETIRILGLIGAIDSFEYKNTLLKSKREELANAAAVAAQQQQARLLSNQSNTNNDGNSNNNMGAIVNLQPGAHAAAQASAVAAYFNNNEQSLDPIEMLISMNSLDEYYPALAIHIMMKTIKNSVSVRVKKDAINALVFAMRRLDNRCVNYVELVIPPFLDLIRTINDNLLIDLIENLGSLIGNIKKHIEPYLNPIIKIIEQNWNIHEKQFKMISALIDLVKSIANVMDIEFKHYLPKILPLVLKQLQTEIDNSTLATDYTNSNTLKILNLFRLCTCCLENYVHLILSQFAQYLIKFEINLQLKQEIMFTIYTFARQITLSDNCAILFQSFIKILEQHAGNLPPPSNQILANSLLLSPQAQDSRQQINSSQQTNSQSHIQGPPILSITYLLFSNSTTGASSLTNEELKPSTDISILTIETLYLLSRQMSGRFFVFAPMFDRILLKNKHYSKLYEQLLINCREATFHTMWSNHQENNNRAVPSGVVNNPIIPSTNEATNSQVGYNAQAVSFGNIKVGIDRAENISSKEGWRESFRKFMASIVQETPVTTLKACAIISYETMPPDLFNACFVSIWIKLKEKEQNIIIRYLELALRNSFVPEVIKIILNLAEFIERCDVGFFLPLDYRLLAEKAFQVKDYAKALHYVEEQFHAIMASPIITDNTNGLYNGVGGVSGYGGGPSSAIMTSNILNMTQSQQQQYLIYLLEQLVTLNHELQRTEAAMGVLDFASKYLKTLDSQTKVKERWYEKLHQWKKALNIYEKNLNSEQPTLAHLLPGGASSYLVSEPNTVTESKLEMLMGRMRCLKGLGEWQKLNVSSNNLLTILNRKNQISQINHQRQSSITSPSTSNIENILVINPGVNSSSLNQSVNNEPQQTGYLYQLNPIQEAQLIEKVAEMGAAACWGLGDWDQMKNYVKYLPENSYDCSLYRSLLALTMNTELDVNAKQNAQSLIEQTRDLLDSDITSMASQSYERSYQAVIEAQVLAELEEIIIYKNVPSKRDWIVETWWKRLQGCERSLEYWHRLLLVRSVVLSREKDIKPWLKFSSLCQKAGHLSLSQQILSSFLANINNNEEVQNQNSNPANNILNTSRDHELCQYANLKFLYVNGSREQAFNGLKDFVNTDLRVKLGHCQEVQKQLSAMGQQVTGSSANLNAQQQFPVAFQMYNIRDLQKRRIELDKQLSKSYLKLGKWQNDLWGFDNEASISTIINYYKMAKDHNQESYKAWQAWAYANYEALQYFKNISNNTSNNNTTYVKLAIEGFFVCIRLSSSNSSNQEANCLQDTLRLLTLWFDYCNSRDIYDVLNQGIMQTPMEIWLQVIPQLIARIDTNKQFVAQLIHRLLTEFGRIHPQALVYRLILASKCNSNLRNITANNLNNSNSERNAASLILQSLREHNNVLVDQAKMVSEELIRVAILWHEMWHESLEEASKLYFGERNTRGMLDTLEPLHNMMDRGAYTNKETAFLQAYQRDLNEARNFCRNYLLSNNIREIDLAWEKYYSVFRRITKQLPTMTTLELSHVSPRLMISRDLELAVPGTYEPNKPLIRIKAFNANIQVISSKQKPRKISIFGSNGFEYVFLLKGHEDLRQDERVMQIFGLVNNLLLKNHETARRDLAIQRYSVIPLSQTSGLLEWLLNCDTLHSLIREFREKKKMLLNLEHKIITKLAPNYESLTSIQKVQIFEMAIESSSGNDLAEILWHKSLTAEKWLERRTNYTRSLAVMSMVGYVLGLGDRHPSNLMLDRTNGKIIHVDFGDCFETAMTREKFPEKIPFRLTRMLKNAMEVTGIEGTFRRTCESVIKVLRSNRDSVMAVLEAFVYDPLVYWKLVEANNIHLNQQPHNPNNLNNDPNANSGLVNNNLEETEETNRKAIMVLNRVKDKLLGTDFSNTPGPIDEPNQVDLLIRQATSSENLCQCFIGWCAWW